MPRFKPPGECPVCGEFVPRGLAACPSCGSCAKSGWSNDADYDGLDLPDDEFDYDEFVAKEFGGRHGRQRMTRRLWWWVALALLVSMIVVGLITGRF